jgi:hypothetical protein
MNNTYAREPQESLTISASPYNFSNSESSSRSYDYSGQDIAHKMGLDLVAAKGAHKQAMMADPLAAVGSRDRIRAMQEYLAAFRDGRQLPGQFVVPGMRLSSSSDQSSNSVGGGPSADYRKTSYQ